MPAVASVKLTTREAVEQYRKAVRIVAGGGRLDYAGSVELDLAMEEIGLPSYAWGRDCRAYLAWSATSDPRRRDELALEYPHLFLRVEPAVKFVRLRRAGRL